MKVGNAFGVDRRHDGVDLCGNGFLWLGDGKRVRGVGTSTRIGISKEMERALRFYERGSRFVSGPKSLNP